MAASSILIIAGAGILVKSLDVKIYFSKLLKY
jgi:hypothetical protein